jgi:hypothetical protein
MTVFAVVFFSALNLAMMMVNFWIARRIETAAREIQASAETNLRVVSLINRPAAAIQAEPDRTSALQ